MQESTVLFSENQISDITDNLKCFLKNDSCNVIFVVSEKVSKEINNDTELISSINEADYIFKGADYEDNCTDVFWQIKKALSESIDEKATVMTFTNKVDVVEYMNYECENTFGRARFCGNCGFGDKTSDDEVINTINSVSPDILCCVFDNAAQGRWIIDNKSKMSAKLCIVVEGNFCETVFRKEPKEGIFSKIRFKKVIKSFLLMIGLI